MKKLPLVVVEWDDTISRVGWTESGEIEHKAPACQSVGWLWKKDNRYTTLLSVMSPGDAGTRQTIPTGCITNIRRIE